LLGGLAQIIGFLLVLRELRRQRRSELGQLGRLGRLWDAVLETIRNPAPVTLELSVAASVSATGILEITTVTQPETPMDELRRRIEEIDGSLRAARTELSAETRNLRDRLDSAVAQYEQRIEELREQRRTDIALAVKNEWVGTLIFLGGVVANLVANLVA